MIALVIGLVVGLVLGAVGLLAYIDRQPDPSVTSAPMLGLQEVHRLRAQTVREMVAAERQIAVPARHYFAVIDGQLVERTVPVEAKDSR